VRDAPRVVLAFALLVLGSGAARAQTAESSLHAFLVARVTWPTPAGERIVAVRVGTKDLVAPLLQELGVTGRSVGLVTQRSIEDLSFASPRDFLVVDGARYDVTGKVHRPVAALSATFFARARTSALRRSDSKEWYFLDYVSEALQIGNLATHGSELTVVGAAQRSARLLTQHGVDLGFLFASVRIGVVGGLSDSYAFAGSYQGATGIVSGWLLRGPEKLAVEP